MVVRVHPHILTIMEEVGVEVPAPWVGMHRNRFPEMGVLVYNLVFLEPGLIMLAVVVVLVMIVQILSEQVVRVAVAEEPPRATTPITDTQLPPIRVEVVGVAPVRVVVVLVARESS
jgi:hypothetical protein